jgi:hypothetical protein
MIRDFFRRYRVMLITIAFFALFLFLISNVDHNYSYANRKILAEIDFIAPEIGGYTLQTHEDLTI